MSKPIRGASGGILPPHRRQNEARETDRRTPKKKKLGKPLPNERTKKEAPSQQTQKKKKKTEQSDRSFRNQSVTLTTETENSRENLE